MLSALALILLLALLSYHAHDPGFANTGEPGPVGNWVGPVGAWLSSFFLFLFGRPAYLFPVMLAYAGWLVHKEQALPDERSRINTLLRAAGLILTLLAEAADWPPCIGARRALPKQRRAVFSAYSRGGGWHLWN